MIELFSANTPNGWKIGIMLEEIGYQYKVTKIDLGKDEQFNPDFLKISPFGKIPVIIDHENNKSIFESGAIEEVLSEHQSVAECAVLGIADKLKGQLPIGLVVLKTGVDKDYHSISKECIQMVRDKIGPVAAFKVVIVIKRLPKTRSGKILRGTIRKIADNIEYKVPPTIDDPAILTEIKEDLIKHKILNNG